MVVMDAMPKVNTPVRGGVVAGPSLRSAVSGLEFGRDFRALAGGGGKACAYRWKWTRAAQPTARIGLGLEMASFFRIAASSGVIRLACTMVSPSAV